MEIKLREDAKPFAIHRARPIPFAQRDAVKATLDKMVRDGVITPVSEPKQRTHPMVVAVKSNCKPRVCGDLTMLNKYVDRPIFPTRTPKDAISTIPNQCRYFTTVDAVQFYHQIPLNLDSQKLTSFITPWGRFMYLRGTMGLNGDEYCRRGEEAVGDLENTIKVVDDVLQFHDDFKSHVEGFRSLLERCRRHQNTPDPL